MLRLLLFSIMLISAAFCWAEPWPSCWVPFSAGKMGPLSSLKRDAFLRKTLPKYLAKKTIQWLEKGQQAEHKELTPSSLEGFWKSFSEPKETQKSFESWLTKTYLSGAPKDALTAQDLLLLKKLEPSIRDTSNDLVPSAVQRVYLPFLGYLASTNITKARQLLGLLKSRLDTQLAETLRILYKSTDRKTEVSLWAEIAKRFIEHVHLLRSHPAPSDHIVMLTLWMSESRSLFNDLVAGRLSRPNGGSHLQKKFFRAYKSFVRFRSAYRVNALEVYSGQEEEFKRYIDHSFLSTKAKNALMAEHRSAQAAIRKPFRKLYDFIVTRSLVPEELFSERGYLAFRAFQRVLFADNITRRQFLLPSELYERLWPTMRRISVTTPEDGAALFSIRPYLEHYALGHGQESRELLSLLFYQMIMASELQSVDRLSERNPFFIFDEKPILAWRNYWHSFQEVYSTDVDYDIEMNQFFLSLSKLFSLERLSTTSF